MGQIVNHPCPAARCIPARPVPRTAGRFGVRRVAQIWEFGRQAGAVSQVSRFWRPRMGFKSAYEPNSESRTTVLRSSPIPLVPSSLFRFACSLPFNSCDSPHRHRSRHRRDTPCDGVPHSARWTPSALTTKLISFPKFLPQGGLTVILPNSFRNKIATLSRPNSDFALDSLFGPCYQRFFR